MQYLQQVPHCLVTERGITNFPGLSSEQMHRFLHFPFESPQYVVFPEVLDTEPDAPLITLFSSMVDTIVDQGLKATATGNLPRAFHPQPLGLQR